MKFIHKIGVELEGGWNKPEGSWKDFYKDMPHIIKEDGSIYLDDAVFDTNTGEIDNDSENDKFFSVYHTDPKYIGPPWREPVADRIKCELASQPFTNKEDLFEWISNYYPQYVNHTCGFHIHISLKSLSLYALLAKKKFYKYFRSRMDNWATENLDQDHEFWKRFDGNNNYCGDGFNAASQLREIGGSRYTNLNFEAYHNHGTIENRLFPMFEKKDLAILAVNEYIDCVESFIEVERDKFFAKSKENVIRVCV